MKKKMTLWEIAEQQCQPDAMTIESMTESAMRAVFLQISHGWKTDFTCYFNENGTFADVKFGADEYPNPKGHGYSVEHLLVTYEVRTTHVCFVTVWTGLWHQNCSGIVSGREFLPFWQQSPEYWYETQAEYVSVDDAPDSPCN
ncbi:hypothetical protein [Reyranella sp.]|uniref:hypothetical protein n=1 Tax=Reyranella sp. TaxID=1929291 RepID=UPI003D11826E